eukprot:scpid50916/ scgid2713/ Replication-associated protein; ATP-dependent helicase Rep; RepP
MARTGGQPHLVFRFAGSSGVWFDGYMGQPATLFDDFDGGQGVGPRLLLRVLDGTQLLVPVKGAFVQWRVSHIFITSALHPNDWFSGDAERDASLGDQIMRRVTCFRDFNQNPWCANG